MGEYKVEEGLGVWVGEDGARFVSLVCASYIFTHAPKRRHQNSLPLTTNFSQKFTEPSKVISYPAGDLRRCFTKMTGLSAYTLHSNPIPQHMVQMAFCDWSHIFLKQVTKVSQHFLVILLWRFLMSPLTQCCFSMSTHIKTA